MANGNPTVSTGSTVQSGGLNYEDYQKKIQSAAAATRATGTTSEKALTSAEKAAKKLQSPYKDVGQAAVESYKQQGIAQEKQAEKAASALEMTGSATLQGLQNIEALQGQVREQVKSASETWGAAAEKADEYVQAARSRVNEVLTKLDTINAEFVKDRVFAKAHAMQAAVQAVFGSMRAGMRDIIENYGTASPEYNQFRASKMTALATIQSNIHASYQQMSEQQNQTYLNAVSDAYTKSNMYLGFQEQQHVEMLKYSQEAKTSYALQATQLDASLEQMKMTGMENIANWILETPSFTMDMTPLMTLLADLKTTQETNTQAAALSKAQTALTSAEARTKEQFADYQKRVLRV
jgi:hypothetical protein